MPNQPAALCVLGCRSSSGDPYPTDNGYQTCARCADKLRAIVVEIVERYAVIALPAALLPSVGEPGRQSPGFGPRSPARDHIIALRDPRTTAVEPGDPHSPLAILWGWARTAREERHLTTAGEPTVATEANTILFHWDWAMRQPWVDDMARELREVLNQLRTANGEPPPKRVGTCIELVDGGDGAEYCGQLLYAPRTGTAITCRSCGRNYDGPDLVRLHLANQHTPEAS